MGYEMKLIKIFGKIELQQFRLALLAGGFLVSMAILTLSKSYAFNFSDFGFWISMHAAPTNLMPQNTSAPRLLDGRNQNLTKEAVNPVCDFSGQRSDVCKVYGDIRIHGNSSSIIFIASTRMGASETNESWQIKPHPRKGDRTAMSNVRELSIRSSTSYKELPSCTHNHTIPAVVFSIGGYMGNIFHDFTDVLIPLFATSHQFQGEVQFLVSDMNPWWIAKYQAIFKQLSRYKVIDLNKDDRVLCYPHTIVGLRSQKEIMSISPSRDPKGYPMVDFARLMRRSYSLQREHAVRLGANETVKPRLFIIARNRTRKFSNVHEIVKMAEELGYEVLVSDDNAASHVAQFARIVNSCDVMVGVHGAGLTNLVFLPTNAIVIQVVPLGRLEWIAWGCFGSLARDSKLRYLQYEISDEESSLKELYPRDHPVFMDPMSFGKQGWLVVSGIYLHKQNVKLNVVRFRPVLLQTLQLLHQ